jgi:hypothetical protein
VSQIRRKSGIGNPVDIDTLVSKSRNREKRSGPSIWKDTWQRSRESRDIGHREIGVLEVMRTGTSKVPKARESIRTVHLQGQVAKDRALSEFCSSENRGFRRQKACTY